MPPKNQKTNTLHLLLPVCFLLGGLIVVYHTISTPAQAANANNTPVKLPPAYIPPHQDPCDGEETGLCKDDTCTHELDERNACAVNEGLERWYGPAGPTPTSTATPNLQAAELEGARNLIKNGNFEFGFYQVPQLGFEPPDVGNVPNDWNWYKNQAYGKYTINSNQTLGLICPDDTRPIPFVQGEDTIFAPVPGAVERDITNALALHMQSTDQNDARLGVYQTVDVTPGQYYRFALSSTFQIQSGGTTDQPEDPKAPLEAPNHTLELYFDHTGNTDWRAIPHERWLIIPIEEEKLEFKVSEDDEDISEVHTFDSIVQAKSNKVTIFMTFWRKWANWRTGIASIDCVSLIPIDPSRLPSDIVQAASTGAPYQVQLAALGVQPTGAGGIPTTGQQTQSGVIIPSAGGILEATGNIVLIIVASLVVIAGLIGAGIWNMRR